MTHRELQFGYHPSPLNISVGPVQVTPLPDQASTVEDIEAADSVENDWIYAPPELLIQFPNAEVRTRPYASRIFGLPKTHVIEHTNADSDDHLTFHIWSLSFFTGMRLTATEAGYVDATPLKSSKLVDFVLLGSSLTRSVELAEAFWIANRSEPKRVRLFAAAVHALFLGQNPRHLQFEDFIFLYTALDACYALAFALMPPSGRLSHAARIDWMCGLFSMQTPSWANPNAPAGAEVATIRNATIHEALFMEEPLGFALHGVGTNQNLNLEMEALICRLLVALLGGERTDYVRSPINTRQLHGLDLQ